MIVNLVPDGYHFIPSISYGSLSNVNTGVAILFAVLCVIVSTLLTDPLVSFTYTFIVWFTYACTSVNVYVGLSLSTYSPLSIL